MGIKQVNTNSRVPIKIWTNDVEEEAMRQLEQTANLPCVFKHLAVMPDVHYGRGSTVGSVIATKKAIIPAAVGVDIGCGMMAVKTDLNHNLVSDNLKKIRKELERKIPVGSGGNKKQSVTVERWEGWSEFEDLSFLDDRLRKKAKLQLGSLGGGNHFIEICLDEDNNVWLMLHSGSRGLGNILATRHIEKARSLAEMFYIELPNEDLAYFVENTKEFDSYIKDLNWIQKYAKQNRIEMMLRILEIVSKEGNNNRRTKAIVTVNCHHNYSEIEHHFGENVWVTRKGAVRAREGDMGIIPGSMGAKSFIVKGLGNKDSFHSCSHGAGRRMSRTEARKQFSEQDLELQTAGVECRKDSGVVDEIPGAYKDIDTVIKNQDDLVETVAVLKQIMCVKG